MIRSCILITVLIVLVGSNTAQEAGKDWYKNSVVYQIYPRSFKDSNGDGIGDLNGITENLVHVKEIGADAVWMSPIFTSPQKDFGYDVSNYIDINEEYGTLEDFDVLMDLAQYHGLKVILDFVPNHSSDQHEWFKQSINRIKPYDEYYVWRDAKYDENQNRLPPNNWLSNFGGSAWEWNDIREQYYLHQFAVGQPDLNYHNDQLQEEMKKVLVFWMDRGVEGFRIDAINHMYEDDQFRDEPLSNIPGVPSDDYDFLNHIYTKNLPETYKVLESWRKLMDDHSPGNTKMILTEAYADFDLTIEYYRSGSTVPFNFMFISDLNNKSTAADFKHSIDRWMNNVPNGTEYVANWVVGNHDNHRAASRFGEERADQLPMLVTILPGVSVIYNGDEIGMVDREFTYDETKDPAGCNAGPDRYWLKSRDPERTPFQWNDSPNAGFSTSSSTWLPVNENYIHLNVEAQKYKAYSHYDVFKRLTALKKKSVIEKGKLETALYCSKCSVAENVLGVVRRYESDIVVLIVNFSDTEMVVIDIEMWLNISEQLKVYTISVGGNVLRGSAVEMRSFRLSASASVVLTTENFLD
ncbi:PREDICTED: maltase 1-like [Cyphomyrmex costatus]|nr:PREDICTED: maltase 1-like [Cyphomyrmex costatus]